ncbi:MAG: hypothetical protein JWO98_5330 [Frankiales bacterium]|nr:hypothetical protein [Frankiales bacterium]
MPDIRYVWHTPESEAAIQEGVSKYFDETLGPRVVGNARRTVPVRTGHLEENIVDEVGRDGGVITLRVGTDVPYGIYVELGTSRMAAQPWLRPAVLQAGGSR